jgi:carbamoyl-phosphate synthase small subunit
VLSVESCPLQRFNSTSNITSAKTATTASISPLLSAASILACFSIGAFMKAILALEDGSVFHGQGFGASASACGEVCFNTSMTGYQEILTDPSYKGQIVTMTYPLIGNYGVNQQDVESWRPHVAGFVIRELSPVVSNWRADFALGDYLQQNGIPGIQGIDTRALTKKLRVRGALKGFISTEKVPDAEAIAQAKNWRGLVGVDYVREVTHKEPFVWDPQDEQSASFKLVQGTQKTDARHVRETLPPADIPIVAYDFGMKYNILRRLRQQGFKVQVVPATTPAAEALRFKPAGIFLSNGPGDPSALDYAVQAVSDLVKSGAPIFGICLGHQILGLALGGKTFKLKFGHRGGNQPVKDLETGRVEITSQNHGFAVDPKSLPSDVSVNRINLNDQTVEGLRHKTKPIYCVQYHPEASPGPHDSKPLFAEFRSMIEKT